MTDKQVWLEICQTAFDTLLEGFSRVRRCSAEGRAAMSIDVSALQTALQTIHSCRPPRGKHHVDAFIQAAYLPEEELLEWVRENWQVYAYRHIAGLLTQQLSSMLNSKKLKDALSVIDLLYEADDKEDNSFSSMLSGRMKEESKLTNMFSQRIRR